jgi:hypothetical protein
LGRACYRNRFAIVNNIFHHKIFFMARFKKGILGGFSGKVGNVVGGSWKGIDYMRSLSQRRKGNPTPAQQAQQAKFKLAVQFLQPFSAVLSIGFRDQAVAMTGPNSAMRLVMGNAILGDYPDYSIDYAKVLISRGDLPNAAEASVSAAGTTLGFTWSDNSDGVRATPTDQALLVVYCPELKQVEWRLNTAQRAGAGATLEVPAFAGMEVQVWLSFVRADGRKTANSRHLGAVNL